MRTINKNTNIEKLQSNLSAKLKKLMKNNGNITTSELARLTKIPQPTIHKLISGETSDPRISTLSAIANVFGINVDFFLDDSLNSNNRQNVTLVPILSWEEILQYETILNDPEKLHTAKEWVQTDKKISNSSFALQSKKSISSIFLIGSILIIDPKISPQDGDYVIFTDKETSSVGLRELIVDGAQKILYSLDKNITPIHLKDLNSIIGVLVQTKLNYRE